jgi:diacylglycerol kinase (ATP)
MKFLIIANPTAGKGRAERKIRALERILSSQGCEVETFVTTYNGEAEKRLSRIEPDIDCVVATGGDGTINEVINGLPDPGRIPIGIFPTGTANVLAKELSLPHNPRHSAQVLLQRKFRRLDMGLIGTRRFLLFVSIGFDAIVTREVLQSRSRLTSYKRYIIPVVKALYNYRIPHLKVKIDNNVLINGGLVLISNTRTYGGIFTITDKAQCDSRYFDICIVSDGSIPLLVLYFISAIFGMVPKIKRITYLTGKKFEITSPEPVAVQIDGDYFGTTPLNVCLSTTQVPVIVP